MLAEVAEKYYAQGYNCAESIIRAGNEVYDLHLHDKDMVMTAAFGGGFHIGDVCGALSGAACVVSARYIEHKAHDQKRMGSRLCAQIKPVFHKPELKCHDTVVTAAQVLEEVLQSWDAEHPGTALAQ